MWGQQSPAVTTAIQMWPLVSWACGPRSSRSWSSVGAVSALPLTCLVSFPHVRGFLPTERRKARGVTLHCLWELCYSEAELAEELSCFPAFEASCSEHLSLHALFFMSALSRSGLQGIIDNLILLVGFLFHSWWLTPNLMKATAPTPSLSWRC